MDKDHNNRVSVDEYIKIFIQAEEVLNNKIQKICASLEKCQAESERVFNDYNEVMQIEKLNEYGIMFGSVLEVVLINADNLRIHNYNQYNVMAYCLISCASRKFQTKLANYDNPVWNESFSL